jgi:hypothetical protein
VLKVSTGVSGISSREHEAAKAVEMKTIAKSQKRI